MFARVITTRASTEGIEQLVARAEDELPQARQRPGFEGYFVLTSESTDSVVIISLWRTREDMEAVARGTTAGIHDDAVADDDVGALHLETYEVSVQA